MEGAPVSSCAMAPLGLVVRTEHLYKILLYDTETTTVFTDKSQLLIVATHATKNFACNAAFLHTTKTWTALRICAR